MCEYIKNTNTTYGSDFKSIERTINDTFVFNHLNLFIDQLNKLYDDYTSGKYKFILGIGYYLKKHHMFYDTTKYLHIEFLLHYYDGKILDKQEQFFISCICDKIISELSKKLKDYKKRLYIAAHHIIEAKNKGI